METRTCRSWTRWRRQPPAYGRPPAPQGQDIFPWEWCTTRAWLTPLDSIIFPLATALCVVSLILHFTKWLPFFVLYFMHIQSIELHNCGDDGGLGLLHGILLLYLGCMTGEYLYPNLSHCKDTWITSTTFLGCPSCISGTKGILSIKSSVRSFFLTYNS